MTTRTPAAPTAPTFWGDPECASCRSHQGGCADHNGPEYRPLVKCDCGGDEYVGHDAYCPKS